MVRIALPALATSWFLQHADSSLLLAMPAVVWALAALLSWCLLGPSAAVAALAAGWTLSGAAALNEARIPAEISGRDVVLRGVICDFPVAGERVLRFVLQPERDGLAAWTQRPLQLSWYEHAPGLRPGERWELKLRLRAPRGLRNPGAFDFERWLYVRGMAGSGYVRPSRLNRQLAPAGHACGVAALRGRLATSIEQALGTHPAIGYILGVTVGATQRLTAADWELLRRTGTTHLLAISGSHITMVALPFLLLGPLLVRLAPPLARWPRATLVPALVVAAAYAMLAGFAVSTVRALIMLAVGMLMMWRRQRVEGVDLLAAAALLVLLLDPPAVVSAGFWLSFLAVAWLFVVAVQAGRDPGEVPPPGGRGVSHLRPALKALVQTQFVLALGLAPLTLAWFQQVSLVAPLANLIAVPVFGFLIVPAALLGMVLAAVHASSGSTLLWVAAEITRALLALLQVAADLPFVTWQPPAAGWMPLLFLSGGAFLLCWPRPLPLRGLAPVLFLPLMFGLDRKVPALRVTAFDVGQGLAVLVETPRHALLYDAGPAYGVRDAGESIVVPALRHMGVSGLDVVMISHHDQDHAGGAAAVLGAFPAARLMAPEPGDLPATRFTPCRVGQSWSWDEVRFTLLGPDSDAAAHSGNDGSCVLLIDGPGGSVLLPGDIGRRREERLARDGMLTAVDLVLASHHGSRSSSAAALVEAVHPRFVVFSAGHRNRWGFPAVEVRERWAATGACLLDTAGSGALGFAAGAGDQLRLVRRERIDAAHLWSADVVHSPPCTVGGQP